MKLPQKLFALYCLLVSIFILLTGLILSKDIPGYISSVLFLPVVLYFGMRLFSDTAKSHAKWIHILISAVILVVLSGLAIINIQKKQTDVTLPQPTSEPLIYHNIPNQGGQE